MIIQAILITATVGGVFYALGRRDTHSGRAWKKIALIVLGASMVAAVLLPEKTTQFANLFGVGRGADLLLYALVVAFIYYTLNNYLHQQSQRNKIYQLARKIAIIEAKEDEHNSKPKSK